VQTYERAELTIVFRGIAAGRDDDGTETITAYRRNSIATPLTATNAPATARHESDSFRK
jgi:hypothetical protein